MPGCHTAASCACRPGLTTGGMELCCTYTHCRAACAAAVLCTCVLSGPSYAALCCCCTCCDAWPRPCAHRYRDRIYNLVKVKSHPLQCCSAAVLIMCFSSAAAHSTTAHLDQLQQHHRYSNGGISPPGATASFRSRWVGVMYAYAGRPKRPCVARVARLGTVSAAL